MSRRRSSIRKPIQVERLSRTCVTFKVVHLTKADALDASERQMAQGEVRAGCHLMPYPCEHCQGWHLKNQQIVPVPGQRRRGGLYVRGE